MPEHIFGLLYQTRYSEYEGKTRLTEAMQESVGQRRIIYEVELLENHGILFLLAKSCLY